MASRKKKLTQQSVITLFSFTRHIPCSQDNKTQIDKDTIYAKLGAEYRGYSVDSDLTGEQLGWTT